MLTDGILHSRGCGFRGLVQRRGGFQRVIDVFGGGSARELGGLKRVPLVVASETNMSR
jgi:hypothetical protein